MTAHPATQEERAAVYANNLKFLPARVTEQLKMLNIEEIWRRIDVVQAQDGYPICRYRENGRLIHVNRIDPIEQARQWSNQFPLHMTSTVFLFGCGFGYTLIELAARSHKDSRILVFECDVFRFASMLHYFDLSDILSSPRFVFFVGDFTDISQAFWEFTSTSHLCFLTGPSILFAPESRIWKEHYLQLQRQIFELMTQQVFKLGNNHFDSMLGFHNMVENASVVVENPYLRTLWRQFESAPVFIVANGPSLDRNIHQLKKVGRKGLILCCESAIATLMRNGIQPDAIVVAERTPASYLYHFQNIQYSENITLLALSVADPRIFRSFPGPKIPIFRSLERGSQWLSRILADGDGVSGGINVSHLAFELAVYLGANPIIFIGQDLAYGTDGMTHSKDSSYADKGQDYIEGIKKSPVVYVEGNQGMPIPSTAAWVDYRKWLEQLIQQNASLTVINATEGGARIQGTQTRELADVIDEYCRDDLPHTLHDLIHDVKGNTDVAQRQSKLQNLVAELKRYAEIYRALGTFAAQRQAKCEQMLMIHEGQKTFGDEEWLNREFEQNLQGIFKFIALELHSVFFQQVILYGCHQMNRLGAINTSRKVRDAIVIQFETFDYLHLICTDLTSQFRDMAHRLAGVAASFGTNNRR